MGREELILALVEHSGCELTENVLMTMSDAELSEHLAEHDDAAYYDYMTAEGWPA
jgi:hypothetical protein